MSSAAYNPLLGRRVMLRPVAVADLEALRMAEMDGSVISTYRTRGMTPSPEQWAQSFWSGVLAQFVVVRLATGEPIGMVSAYRPDNRHGTAYLAAYIFMPFQRLAWPMEGLRLFVSYLFRTFPLRKLYGVALDANLDQYRSILGGVAHEEGRLRDHEYLDGRYVDLVTLALYREQWTTSASENSGLLTAIEHNSATGVT